MHLVPWDYDFTKEDFDGLFISNGPGDPAMVHTTINNISQVNSKLFDTASFIVNKLYYH